MRRFQKKIKLKKIISLSDIVDSEIKMVPIRQGFPKNVGRYSRDFKNLKYNEHKDMTHIPFVTVDGDDSKDFDDAIFAEEKNGETKIFIAIADVSFFVKKDDPIDLEAKKRGNSFYFPDRVIPMLPEILSNNICSLKPNKIRAAIICEVTIKDEKVIDYKFHRAKIMSVARLTYQNVDEIIFNKKNSKLKKILENLFKAFQILSKISNKNEKLEFKVKEYKISVINNKEFEIESKQDYQSYRLIEEFMVLANNVVAKFLISNGIKSAFRNHDKPKKEKIKELAKVLNKKKINDKKKFNTQVDFNFYLKSKKSKNFDLINDLMLKCQSKAYYGLKNIGHFGLGLKYYTHFTSPIRRYSDLLVHRDLIETIFDRNANKHKKDLMVHLTNQEKKSDELERKIIDRACSIYIKNKKRYFFTGVIDGIESFGIFVKARELPFSGLARFTRSNSFSETNKFELGQIVSFKVIKNNLENGKILLGKIKIINDYE